MPKFVSPSGRQYTQKKELGTGAFGNIIVCKDSEHEKDFIIKRVRLARQTPQERFSSVQELAMMQQLRHRNLIRGLDGWLENKHTTCLVMESCSGGDLASLLEGRQGTKLDEQDIHMMIVQLASAVSYLHSVKILHRDIKSSNVFIGDKKQLKLGDLGLCRQLNHSEERPQTSAGTLNYMAPELAKEESYSKPADIWALGCVIYEVCALKPAFHSFNCDGIIKKIKSGKVPAIPSEFSEPLRRLVRTMLYTDECKRPSAEDILAMPFLQDAKTSVEEIFGPISSSSEGPLGPDFRYQDVPREWRTLMKRFHADHKQHGKTGGRQNMSRDLQSAAAGKAHKARGGWRLSTETDDENDTASSGSDKCKNSTANARSIGSRTMHSTQAYASQADTSQIARTEANPFQSFTTGGKDALTRLQPSDGEELMKAAESSLHKQCAAATVDLPTASSITSELLEGSSSGSALKAQGSWELPGASKTGSRDIHVASNRSTVHGRSTDRSSASHQAKTGGVAGSAIAHSPAMADNSASGAEYERTNGRQISSVNRKLNRGMEQDSACHGAVTGRKARQAAGVHAPGALKSAATSIRASSARTSLYHTQEKHTTDKPVWST